MKCELKEEILELQAGDHLCLFYEKEPAEQMPALVPFIQDSLTKDEQFIYIADDQTVEELSGRLEQSGINVGQESGRGRLKLWTRREWRQPGRLDLQKKSAQVRSFITAAGEAGFKGVRFAVEMTWTLGPDISARELEAWEATLNTIFLPESNGRIVCQYNRSRLSPEVMLCALHTHPLAILGEEVCANIFYQAPLLLNGKGRGNGNGHPDADARLDWMVAQLKRASAAEKQRQELVRHRAALSEAERSQKRIEQILDSITDGFLALDLDWRFTLVNRAAQGLLKKSAAEVLGKNFWEVFPEARDTALEAELHRAMTDQQYVGLEYFYSPSNCWFEIRAYPSAKSGVSVYFADITKRKSGEEASRRLAAIVESSEDAIMSTDLNGVVTSWNQGAERLYGYRADEIVGRRVTVLIPLERPEEEPGIFDRIRRGERIQHYETVRRRKDGTLVEVSLAVSPLKDEKGKIIGASKTARDITERKRAESEVRHAKEQLARSNEELEKRVDERTASLRAAIAQMEEFSYSVSHDLRAPVRAMQGYAQAVLEDYGERIEAQGKEYLERILRGSSRMERLIHDILTYSRLARYEIQLQPVSLDKLVQEIVHQYPEMQPPRAEIQIEGPLAKVLGHEPSLVQALSNLLGNAVKFVPPQTIPKVRLRTERQADRARLWIEDNGIGIKPEHQQRLFGLFERIHPGKRYDGTGIGLAIVRKAAERMGGKAGLESDGLTGSRFWIELAVAE